MKQRNHSAVSFNLTINGTSHYHRYDSMLPHHAANTQMDGVLHITMTVSIDHERASASVGRLRQGLRVCF